MAVARGRNRGLSGTDLMECTDVCSLFFFFSSRRRHTRCGREWSSDVCSSDLSRNLALDKLHIDSMGTWRLTLRSGVVLVLGDSDIQEKMQEFFYVYDHYLVNIFSAVVSIDMRYANGLAIAWADGYDVVIEGAG